ncbi:MAG TPA: hypothetical protein VMW56_14480 [Candidatus Margulisiibacteriota bacterium]|nr:hypothetical protein [Candidatus Margulisiibacteriota bacterium]
MGATNFDGPAFVYGDMGALAAAYGEATPDYNLDAGPGMTFQGDGIPDVRFPFMKDKVQGYTGTVPGFANLAYLQSVDTIPITASTTNLANTQAGTSASLTMRTTSTTGVTAGIPIIPQPGVAGVNPEAYALNGGTPITNSLLLDFGFAFGNVTSGSKTVVVADSTYFAVGLPLVIADAVAAGTALLTWCTGITDATHITINDTPTNSVNPTPIGTGNLWSPSEVGPIYPTAHLPYQAGGPGLFLDPTQALARNVQVTAAAGATATSCTVRGYDVYFNPLSEQITVTAGSTVQGKKAFKAVTSATLNAADAGHNYSVGTGDLFGFNFRSDRWEYTNIFYNGGFAVSNTGWTGAVTTAPATATTGDVRGTVAVASLATIGAASNGSISSLALTGRRLAIFQSMPLWNMLSGHPGSPQWMFGQAQFNN